MYMGLPDKRLDNPFERVNARFGLLPIGNIEVRFKMSGGCRASASSILSDESSAGQRNFRRQPFGR